MGKHAAYRRRGSHADANAPLVAPVLAVITDDTIEWTWAGSNPDFWQVFESSDGGGPFASADTVPGVNRTESGLAGGDFFYVFGTDGMGHPVTALSNIVQLP